MSRKRYLHTDISIDGAVNRLARNSGDFAALFYTWLIPHATDDGIVRGDEEKLILLVIPGRRDKKVADVAAALEGMEREGLIEWHREEKEIWFPADSFYKYQKYISADNRRGARKAATVATNDEQLRKAQKVAENPVSPSPSPSPPPSESTTREETTTHSAATPRGRVVYLPAFELFWKAYGKFVGKKEAYEQWKRIKPDAALLATILEAVEGQRGGRKWLEGFQPDAVRWLKGEHWNDAVETPRPGGKVTPIRPPAAEPFSAVAACWSDVASELRRWEPGQAIPRFIPDTESIIAMYGGWEEFVALGATERDFAAAWADTHVGPRAVQA